MRSNPLTSPHHQHGIGLLEALLALLVLALGLLATAKLHGHLRLHADIARQQSQAVRLAQEDLERLRAYAVLAGGGGQRAYADIAASSARADEGARFTVTPPHRRTAGPARQISACRSHLGGCERRTAAGHAEQRHRGQ
jgi:Tfp pilus assembly protein PilV